MTSVLQIYYLTIMFAPHITTMCVILVLHSVSLLVQTVVILTFMLLERFSDTFGRACLWGFACSVVRALVRSGTDFGLGHSHCSEFSGIEVRATIFVF